MSYDYCCIYCGKKLNQKKREGVSAIVYDISPVLNAGQPFSALRFRITEEHAIRWAQEPGTFYNISLTPEAVLGMMSQPWNHDRREIRELKRDDLELVAGSGEKLNTLASGGTISTPQNSANSQGGLDEEPSAEQVEQARAAAEEERAKAFAREQAVLRLFQGSNVKGDVIDMETGIRPELTKYWTNASKDKDRSISFEIKRTEEYGITRFLEIRQEGRTMGRCGRLCPVCGSKVVEQAGAVPHRMVGFIANPRSAKTSTIIALSQFMDKAVWGTRLEGIWGESDPNPDVNQLCPPLLSQADHESTIQFWKDFERFELGQAPSKTQETVYNPTFFVKDNHNKRTLLTLVDIPGEYCPRKGDANPHTKEIYKQTSIDGDALRTKYQIILNCDAYITCFDTSVFLRENTAYDQGNRNIYLHAPIIWVNEIQKLRIEDSGIRNNQHNVPIMVLLTKCKDLEIDFPKQNVLHSADPMEQVYMFAEDYQKMMPRAGVKASEMQEITKMIMSTFKDNKEMENAFFAMLRCSPFGFDAPGYDAKDEKAKAMETGRKPSPKNIDRLMDWILRITGCIPTRGQYDPDTGEDNAFVLDDGYYAEIQYRSEQPKDDKEALARSILFVNPGYIDKRTVEYHPKGLWLERIAFQIYRKLNPRLSNTKEEKSENGSL